MTDEACNITTGSVAFQITSSARRCIDPQSTLVLLDGGATIAWADVTSVDFQFGEIVLDAPSSGALTVTGNFLPLTTASELITEGKEFTLSLSKDLLDSTVFSPTAQFRKRKVGLGDMEATVTMFLNDTDLDTLGTYKDAGSLLCLDVYTGATPYFRGFCRIGNIERSGSVDGLLEATVSFSLSAEKNEASGFFAGYSDKAL
jgi:hypothetical protein